MLRNLLLIQILLSLTGCASYFTRKSCESTNWFSYGEKVALEGRRLTGDAFISQCYKAEADVAESDLDRGFKSGLQQYCTPTVVFQNGKNGNFFNEEMCVGEGINSLRAQHRSGVLEYCDRANGYTAGAKGKAYNKICPIELEKSFLPEFNRGRRSYLSTVISQNNTQISELNTEVSKLQSELSYKRGLLFGLQARANQSKQNLDFSTQLSKLNSEVTGLESKVRSATERQNNLKAKNREIEIEMLQLGR